MNDIKEKVKRFCVTEKAVDNLVEVIKQEQLALLGRLKKQPVSLSDSGSYVWAVPLEVINQEEERIRGK